MNPAIVSLLAASTITTIGTVIAVLAGVALLIFVVVNLRSGHEEIGAEIELAPNRKPYLDDEQMETTRLTRTLGTGMALLGIVALGLPIYWLAEPGRMEGAVENFTETFAKRGLEQYETGSACVNCHSAEGKGGVAPYTILDDRGEFVASVNWLAPALNTVLLRFSRDEVHQIIEFGRPGTPMPAWGAGGGGPRSEQQIDDLVEYLNSIQLPYEQAQHDAQVQLAVQLGILEDADREDDAKVQAALAQIDYSSLETGQNLFNLGKDPVFAGGAYACGRCHTRGWSIVTSGDDAIKGATLEEIAPYVDYSDGAGGYGWTLDNLIPRKFLTMDDLAEFINTGSVEGIGFGTVGQGTGRMPGYGDNPNTEDVDNDGMWTPEMICAAAQYVSTLRGGEGSSGDVPTTTVPPSTTTTTTQPTTTTTSGDSESTTTTEGSGGAQQGYCELAAATAAGEAQP